MKKLILRQLKTSKKINKPAPTKVKQLKSACASCGGCSK